MHDEKPHTSTVSLASREREASMDANVRPCSHIAIAKRGAV